MCASVKKAIPTRLRYFVNSLPDYDPATNSSELDRRVLKKEIYDKSLICADRQPCSNPRNLDGGLYVGSSGIGYMFYHMSKSSEFADFKNDFINRCLDILKVCISAISTSKRAEAADKCGFLLGHSGTYAVAAAAYKASGNEEEANKYIKYFKDAAPLCDTPSYPSDELFVGRAGYVCGALWLNKEFRDHVIPEEIINKMCNTILESGRKYSKRHHSPCPLMFAYYGTEYLGAAHGLCSILQMLISCDSFLEGNPSAEKDIKESVNYLLSLQTKGGNFPCAMDELGKHKRSEENELVHWCHGAPGVVYLLAKAYLKWEDKKYLNAALRCGEVTWKKGLLKKGPGICHGVAGSGYVFLLLFRLTGDKLHYHRANEFAKFLSASEFISQARTPDTPYSLFEGFAGTVCFLTDLLQPSNAAYPFMDVF